MISSRALLLGTAVVLGASAVEAQAPGFRSVNADFESTCAIETNGRAWCWGQLSFDRATRAPGPHAGTSRFLDVAIAGNTMCGLATDSIPYCLGEDGYLGFRRGRRAVTPTEQRTPVRLTGVPLWRARFRHLSVGAGGACGVEMAGQIHCWGWNSDGRFGNGSDDSTTLADADHPASTVPAGVFTSVALGYRHACALTGTGVAWCWGGNQYGQLGNGTMQASTVPRPVAGEHRFRLLSINPFATCGVTLSGDGLCWGGVSGTGPSSPAPIAGGHRWRVISLGTRHACGVTEDGTALCWGSGTNGALGTGEVGEIDERSGRSSINRADPVPVVGGLRFASIAAGYDHTCGVTENAEVWCWGGNASGQLGLPRTEFTRGTGIPQRVPIQERR